MSIEQGGAAGRRFEHLVGNGRVDKSGQRHAVPHEAHRDRPVGIAPCERLGAIDGVDDPDIPLLQPRGRIGGLFRKPAEIRSGRHEPLAQVRS